MKRRMFSAAHARNAHGTLNASNKAYAGRLEAKKLAGEIADYWVESLKFRVTEGDKSRWYTPDFVVQENDGTLALHEVKGGRALMTPASALRLEVCADKYPFRFVVAYQTKTGWELQEVISENWK